MNESIASILEQAKQFVQINAPADLLREAVPFGIICLLVGIGLSVLGAKLARFGMTGVAILVGAWVGVQFSDLTGFAKPVCGLAGAAMLGIVAYQTFRLWVGVVAALVAALVVAGVFGYNRVVPHVEEFNRTAVYATVDGSTAFALPSPDQQQDYLQRGPREWGANLWSYVTSHDPNAERNGKAIVLGAMVTGLCLGVVAMRLALILSTSLLGTGFVTAAITTLGDRAFPGTYETFQTHPTYVGVGVGAFLVMSLVVQTMLTRSAPKEKREGKGE